MDLACILCSTTNSMVAVNAKPEDKMLTQSVIFVEDKNSDINNTIASYADGAIEIRIPMDEVKPFLNF